MPLGYFIGIPLVFVRGSRVRLYVEVNTRVSCLLQKYSKDGFGFVVFGCFDSLFDVDFWVGDFVDDIRLIWRGVPYLRPCAEAAYGGGPPG